MIVLKLADRSSLGEASGPLPECSPAIPSSKDPHRKQVQKSSKLFVFLHNRALRAEIKVLRFLNLWTSEFASGENL